MSLQLDCYNTIHCNNVVAPFFHFFTCSPFSPLPLGEVGISDFGIFSYFCSAFKQIFRDRYLLLPIE